MKFCFFAGVAAIAAAININGGVDASVVDGNDRAAAAAMDSLALTTWPQSRFSSLAAAAAGDSALATQADATWFTFCNGVPPIYTSSAGISVTAGGASSNGGVLYKQCQKVTGANAAPGISAMLSYADSAGTAKTYQGTLTNGMCTSGLLNVMLAYFDPVSNLAKLSYPMPSSTASCTLSSTYRTILWNAIQATPSNVHFTADVEGKGVVAAEPAGSPGYGIADGAVISSTYATSSSPQGRVQARLGSATASGTLLVDDAATVFNQDYKFVSQGQSIVAMFTGVYGNTQYPPTVFYSTAYGNSATSAAAINVAATFAVVVMALVAALQQIQI